MKNVNIKLNELIIKAQGERSQNEYALQSGIDSATISRYLKGIRKPRIDILRALSLKAHNGVTYEDFLFACGYINNKTNQPPENIMSAEEQAFIETFRQLTEEEKKEFYSIANFILAKRK